MISLNIFLVKCNDFSYEILYTSIQRNMQISIYLLSKLLFLIKNIKWAFHYSRYYRKNLSNTAHNITKYLQLILYND